MLWCWWLRCVIVLLCCSYYVSVHLSHFIFVHHIHCFCMFRPLKGSRHPMWAQGRCRISPRRFLAECCKRQLNQGNFVLLYFRLFTFSDLYWVFVFSCTVLFVSISQVIGCEDRLRNDLYCVRWGVKLYSNQTVYLFILLVTFSLVLPNLSLNESFTLHLFRFVSFRNFLITLVFTFYNTMNDIYNCIVLI